MGTINPFSRLDHHIHHDQHHHTLPSINNLMSPPEPKSLEHLPLLHQATAISSPPPSRHGIEASTSAIVGSEPPALSSVPALIPDLRTPEAKLRVLPSPPTSPPQDRYALGEGMGFRRQHRLLSNGSIDLVLKDPILFAGTDHVESALIEEEPLFHHPAAVAGTEDLITKHMAMHLIQFKNKLNQPTRDEYRLALACVPTVGSQYNRDPGAYLKRRQEEQENEYWQVKRICANPGVRSSGYPSSTGRGDGGSFSHASMRKGLSNSTSSSYKQRRPNLPLGSASENQQLMPSPNRRGGVVSNKPKRIPKQSPITKLMNFPVKGRQAADALAQVNQSLLLGGAHSSTVASHMATKREDIDFVAIPDYSPPLSSLPANQPRALKADWPSSNTLNLSQDPDRHLLAEAEVHLASTLRLNCATYLCSKRRIMQARLTALRIGKEFRKTDAQQACKIDVNKASKLWGAFDRVGWFDRRWFEQFLTT